MKEDAQSILSRWYGLQGLEAAGETLPPLLVSLPSRRPRRWVWWPALSVVALALVVGAVVFLWPPPVTPTPTALLSQPKTAEGGIVALPSPGPIMFVPSTALDFAGGENTPPFGFSGTTPAAKSRAVETVRPVPSHHVKSTEVKFTAPHAKQPAEHLSWKAGEEERLDDTGKAAGIDKAAQSVPLVISIKKTGGD